MKYIIAHLPGEKAVPVLFPPFISHLDMANWLSLSSAMITSAGFCRIDGDGKVDCAGFSTALNLGPTAFDAALISMCIRHTNAEYPAKPNATSLYVHLDKAAVKAAMEKIPDSELREIALSSTPSPGGQFHELQTMPVPSDPHWADLQKRFGSGSEL